MTRSIGAFAIVAAALASSSHPTAQIPGELARAGLARTERAGSTPPALRLRGRGDSPLRYSVSSAAATTGSMTPLSSLFQDIGTLGGATTTIHAIADGGLAVGESLTAGGETHAFLWTPSGGMLDLGVLPDTTSSRAMAVNANGQVVGLSDSHVFLWTATGGMVDLGFEGTPTAFSAAGHIVGTWMPEGADVPSGFYFHEAEGFVEIGGEYVPIAVNSQGWVVGTRTEYDDDNLPHTISFFFSTGEAGAYDIGGLGGDNAPVAINERGDVIGWSFLDADPEFGKHAYLFTQSGAFDDIGNFMPTALNEARQVVGYLEDDRTAVSWRVDLDLTDLTDQGIAASGPTHPPAFAVNDYGELFGFSIDPTDLTAHLFTWNPVTGATDYGADQDTTFANLLSTDGGVFAATVDSGSGPRGLIWMRPAPARIPQDPLAIEGAPGFAAFQTGFEVTVSGGSGSGLVTVTVSGICEGSFSEGVVSVFMQSGTGTCQITAAKTGDVNYEAVTSSPVTVTAVKIPQMPLTVAEAPPSWPYNATFLPTFWGGGSGAGVTLLTTGPCQAEGSLIRMTAGSGTCVITPFAAGDDNFEAITGTPFSVVANTSAQPVLTIVGAPASASAGDSFIVSTVGGAGTGAVTFLATGACANSGAQVVMTSDTGTCAISAVKAGDGNYEPTVARTSYRVVSNLGGTNAPRFPNTGVTVGGDGWLYVTTNSGGASNRGTIFRLDLSGATLQTLHSFTQSVGGPSALTVAADGLLYGTASEGGAFNRGMVFSISTAGQFTLIHSFNTTDGRTPRGRLIDTGDGLVGITRSGGANGSGTFFHVAYGGPVTTLRHFTSAEGPVENLFQGVDSRVYGLGGENRIIDINPSSGAVTVVHQLDRRITTLMQAGDATFYATRNGMSQFVPDEIFRVESDSSLTTLHQFDITDGGQPTGLVEGPDGLLYGALRFGGVFGIDANHDLAVLHSIGGTVSQLVRDDDGTLYGTTFNGGNGSGSVFAVRTDAAVTVEAVAGAGTPQSPLVVNGAPAAALFNTSFNVTVTGGSGSGALTIMASGACANPGGGTSIVMTSGSGTCTVSALKDGDGTFRAATALSAFVTAEKASQEAVVVFGAPATATFGTVFAVTASGGTTPDDFVFSTMGSCSNLADTITMTGSTGACVVVATRPGGANYSDAVSTPAIVSAVRNPQPTLVVTGAPASAIEGSTFVVSTSGGSGTGPIVFTFTGVCDSTATSDAASITITSVTGSCEITATKYGDSLFNDATSAPVTVVATAPEPENPTITAISPAAGTVDGGVSVTIRGANFLADATVTFDGVTATSVTVDDPFTITAVAPAHAVALVDVAVSTDGNTRSAVLPDAFAYGPAPEVGLHGLVVRADLADSESQLPGGHGSGAMSGNGRFVAFISPQELVVPGDTNGRADLFVRDLENDSTEQVNLTNAGAPGAGGTGPTGVIVVSDDGRFVAFTTTDALDATDTNGALDVYLRDRIGAATERISLNALGSQLPNGVVGGGSVSTDGRYVAFVASGAGITPDDTFAGADVFVRDRLAGATALVSAASDGSAADAPSSSPWMNADGRFVVFTSAALNLAAGGAANVFLRDRDTNQNGVFDEPGSVSTTLVSHDTSGNGGDGASWGGGISSNGAFVVFDSAATTLVDGDSNGVQDVFLFERASGAVSLLSHRPTGASTSARSWLNPGGGGVSADGRFVVFTSDDAELVPFDGNRASDVFRRDRHEGLIALASVREDGSRSDTAGLAIAPASLNASIGNDGRRVLFASDATNLVADDTNHARDLFVKTLTVNTPVSGPGNEPVVTAPIDQATGGSPVVLEFAQVLAEGTTSLTTITEPEPLPGGFSVGTAVYEITTTAVITGTIDLCISYAGQDVGDESSLVIMHYVDGAWEPLLPATVKLATKEVCGPTSSLSPFTIGVPTATAISASATASSFASTTSFTADVTPVGLPGTVVFNVAGTDVAADYDPSTGHAFVASYQHGLAAQPSPYDVAAHFTPSAINYARSTATVPLAIGKAAASVAFVPATLAQNYDGQIKIVGATTSPEGLTVSFSFTGTPRDAGDYPVAATIVDANYQGSATASLHIDRASTTTTLTSSPNPSNVGQAVTFTAHVTSAGETVTTGAVSFKEGATVLGTTALDSTGHAGFSTSSLSSGAHTIVASYDATANFTTSQSDSITQSVQPSATAYTFTGFFAPIDMPQIGTIIWNTAKAGQTIPAKWQLTNGATPVADPSSFVALMSYAVNCTSGTGSVDLAVEEYASGNSSLQYNGDGNWQYNWKTPSSYKNTCRVMYVRLSDGTNSAGANLKFK